MPTFLSVSFFVIATVFIGFNIICFFDRRNRFTLLERLALSYLFGIGAVSLEMFILGLFKIPFLNLYLLLPWVVLSFVNIILYKKNKIDIYREIREIRPPARFNMFEKLLISLLSFEIAYTFFRSLMKPIESYDSVALWSLKGKILYLAQRVPDNFFYMLKTAFHGAHADYPLLLPFSEAWFYTFVGGFNDYLVKILFPLNFVAFLFVFYFLLKRISKKRETALLFTFILASIKQFNDYATVGSADLPMAVYTSLTFLFLFIWTNSKNGSYLTACVLSCIFAFWTKNEGTVVLFITLCLLIGMLKYFRDAIFGIFILITLFSLWFLFKANMGLEGDVVNIDTFKRVNIYDIWRNVFLIGYEYQKHIFGFKKWNLIWILFLSFAIFRNMKIFKNYKYILLPILFILLFYTGAYLVTPQDISWHLRSSASRLLIHILPLAVFLTALNVNDVYNEES